MVYLRNFALTATLLVYYAAAAPLQSSVAPLKLNTRSGVEDIELRPIARSSVKRDQVNNLVPQSTTLHLDYVD
ncbi:hypothetical protein MMC30_006862, partial [Trapelia coarctata]|nr:hypothetical protein [Trapelia coarctata]